MRHLLILLVLLLLMQAALHFGTPVDGQAFDSLTLVTTGFILVGAYTMGELFRRMRLPALLGYLAAGVLFGPKLALLLIGDDALAPIGTQAIHELSLINVLAVGVIGTMGGGEIKLPELRENFGKLVAICGSVFVLVLPVVAGLVLGMTFVAPQLVPFLAELPLAGRIAGALLFGTLAVGMSPAATLALLQEVRAHGRFTSLVLGAVVLGDLVLVATFLLMLALAKLLVSPEGLSLARLGEELPAIAAEFGWALAIGVIVGLLYILYLRFVRREILLFSLGVVFVTSFVSARLHAETLLAFLIAGFVVQNFSRHGHTLIEAFERISLPVFVIYFTTQAAALDLVAVTAYLPLTLMLVAARVGLFWFGVGFGARRAGVDDSTRAHLQLSFFSQGGVDLVLAAMIAEAIPGWGTQVQIVTVATVLFYVIGGPPFLARALDAVGESEAARERGAEDLESRVVTPDLDEDVDEPTELRAPAEVDPLLQARLAGLHELVVDLRTRLIDGQVLARARLRRQVVERLTTDIDSALACLSDAVDPDDDGLGQQARAGLAALDEAICSTGRVHSHATLEPFDGRTLVELLREIDGAQQFGESYRVVRAEPLFEPRGGRISRTIRMLRRWRRKLVGPGQRTVPLGRLWRYHVSLNVPVMLWSATRPAEAELWHMVLDHDRITRRQLRALLDGSWATIEASVSPDPGPHDHGHDHDHDGSEPPAEAPPSLDEWLEHVRSQAQARSVVIRERVAELDAALERGLTRALVRAWSNFLDSVELAGTLELPAWRYRPSSRYDAARAATAELLEVCTSDRERAAGRFDAMLAVAHTHRLARVIRVSAAEFVQRFVGALAELDQDFDAAVAAARTLAEQGASVELTANSSRMRQRVDQLRRQLSNLASLDPPVLRQIVAETPELLAPSSQIDADADARVGDARRTPLRLRAWLSQTLAQEFAATRAAADEELGGGLANLRHALVHVTQVVDYNLGTYAHAQRPADDAGLGERVAGLLERARGEVDNLACLARVHVDERIDASERASLSPIDVHRWDEIRRRLRREERPSAAAIEWLRERGDAGLERLRQGTRGLVDELVALVTARPSRAAVRAWRRALLGPRSTMPESYQRLFTSVPAETVGLLISRPELTVLERQTERWLQGRGGPMLIYGDRGAGKRTLARQLIGAFANQLDVSWLRLTPTFEREVDVRRELARRLGLSTDEADAQGFTSLARDIISQLPSVWRQAEQRVDAVDLLPGDGGDIEPRRIAIVVENTERLFRRTHEGLACMREFLALVAATSEQVLWMLLMAESAVVVLDPALELRARFPEPLHVPPMSAAELEQVFDARHRLSGYRLRLEPGAPSLAMWLRAPRGAWRQWQRHDHATYESLARVSGGNVRQALRLWLVAAHTHEYDASTVVVGPLLPDTCTLLDDLPLSSRVLLSALMLHGPLPRADLGALYYHHALDLDGELARLAHLGLIVFDDNDAEIGPVVAVDTRLVQPLTAELRACNLL